MICLKPTGADKRMHCARLNNNKIEAPVAHDKLMKRERRHYP